VNCFKVTFALLACLFGNSVSAEDVWEYSSTVETCYEKATMHNGSESCIGDAATICMDTEANGYTTLGMMFCFSDEAGVWDDYLNEEYQKARDFAERWDDSDRALFPEYAIRAEQVLLAQRAWIDFRNANCAMSYGRYGAGSLRQVSGAHCQLRMTAERVLELAEYRGAMR